MKFNVMGDGRCFGVFSADSNEEAQEVVASWAKHHRFEKFAATPIDPMIEWIEPRANEYLKSFRVAVTVEKISSRKGEYVVDHGFVAKSLAEIERFIESLKMSDEIRLRGTRADLRAVGAVDYDDPTATILDFTHDDCTYGAYPTD